MRHSWLPLVLCCSLPLAAACGGDRADAGENTRMRGGDTSMQRDTGGGQAAREATPEMIAQGREIFQGKSAGGICYTCHGDNAQGTPNGPNLTDDQWLNTDGSLAGIEEVIREGVSQPKEHTAPMPPFGGMLNDEQIESLAAYVHSLRAKTR